MGNSREGKLASNQDSFLQFLSKSEIGINQQVRNFHTVTDKHRGKNPLIYDTARDLNKVLTGEIHKSSGVGDSNCHFPHR